MLQTVTVTEEKKSLLSTFVHFKKVYRRVGAEERSLARAEASGVGEVDF
jgi:hypothetical protein